MSGGSLYNNGIRLVGRVRNNQGVVLLVTLVILVVLSTLGYTLSVRLSAQRHRDQYIIDYQTARYACDSAVKYALATLQDIQPELISRPNDLDFSDLFILSKEEYEQLLADFAAKSSLSGTNKDENLTDANDTNDINSDNDNNDINDIGDINGIDNIGDISGDTDANSLVHPTIPGPYGPPWPFITEPVEFEIGSATVSIKIEDENAKYPLGWALLEDANVPREAEAGFKTFCEWVGYDPEQEYPGQTESLKSELEQIRELKTFKLDFSPISRAPDETTDTTTSGTARRGRRPPVGRGRSTIQTISPSVQINEQTTHFAKIFHSSLIDTETLAKPYIEGREESALKYISLGGARTVNINTAPRHVLEAAFAFGGDAREIAEAIIQRRRVQPFKDIKDLRHSLFSYSDSLGKCEKYITTVSNLFTIKITAVSGTAEASSVITVMKAGKTLNKVAVVSD